MFPRLEKFLAALAVTVLVVTAVFWTFPPALRFPDPRPDPGIPRMVSAENPAEAAPATSPAPARPPEERTAPATREEPAEPAVLPAGDEKEKVLPATLSVGLREALREASLSDDDIRVLAEAVSALRESLQNLRDAEGTPENADRIRELTGRIEDGRRQIERTAGMSITEFVSRTSISGIGNGRGVAGAAASQAPEGAGR